MELLLNVMWQPGQEGNLGENAYMYMTTLLIGYMPIQNKKLKKKKTGISVSGSLKEVFIESKY